MRKLTEAKQALFEVPQGSIEFERRKDFYLSLYFAEREKYDKGILANMTLSQHRALHKILLPALKISNRLQGHRYEILYDERIGNQEPKIFAATHIGKSDIEMLCGALGEHCHILTNAFESMSHTFDGLALSLNGVIYFNHIDKPDRRLALEKMAAILEEGGNVLLFPEGAYNLKPSTPVTPLNWGVIKTARSTNARIVPVAIEQYGNDFKIAIGTFDTDAYENNDTGDSLAADGLRDTLAGLKWKIWESMGVFCRDEVVKTDWDLHMEKQLAGTGDTVADIERERYHPKDCFSLATHQKMCYIKYAKGATAKQTVRLGL